MLRLLTPLTATLACTLAATAHADTLIPLDSRPATRSLPAQLAALTGRPVQVPPAELLGTAARGADPAALSAWLDAQPVNGPLFVSLDALGYGGLVQSRRSADPAATVLARLEPLRAWQQRSGQPVYAFITLPREPDAMDRARNLEVARTMIQWAGQGTFAELHVTWDDALPGNPAPQEGAELARTAPPNVQVYPGADEVLATLIARAAPAPLTGLRAEYSNPAAASQVIRYEGVPLEQSVALHARAAGYTLLPPAPAPIRTPFGGEGAGGSASVTLYVYNGGDPRAAALRVSQLVRQAHPGEWVAVADVERVNVGNLRLWGDLNTLKRPPALAALAAWGTPGNNVGTALAHARLVSSAGPALDPAAQDALLAREYANDVLYSSQFRARLRALVPDAQLAAPGGEASGEAALRALLAPAFPLNFARTYDLAGVSLPWQRSFEAELQLVARP